MQFINVSNRLPVSVGETIRKTSGGLVAALEAVQDKMQFQWVGWPGAVEEEARQSEIDTVLRKDYGYIPVFLTPGEVSDYYTGFANSSLWPLLHYLPAYMRYEAKWWDAYEAVNRHFARKVIETAGENGRVWVHDYHLMRLPAMLRAERPDLRIGFFLHTPFPSYEVFRCHPRRRELLEGLLGADLIGFHTFGYLRHFQSTLLRILGVEAELNHLTYGGRRIYVSAYPIGINAGKFIAELESDPFRKRREELREIYKGKKIILGVERLDYTKGLIHRLQAVDLFLSACSNRGDIVFVLICVPSREDVAAYKDLLAMVESQVGQINGRYATVENTPIHFIHNPVDFTELCALYSLSDVAMVTPLRDGMNLVAKEYVACQEEEDAGVLLLSEFAGAAEELFSALIVNPYDEQGMVDRLGEALHMELPERQLRMNRMRQRVLRFDARYWAERFLTDLETKAIFEGPPMEPSAEIAEIGPRFAAARNIALFLDYDGTLREFEFSPETAAPTEEVLNLLRRLANRAHIDTFILSGRRATDLDAWLGGFPFTLIAEHGFTFRRAGRREWELFSEAADLTWKDRVWEVLRHYEGNTPGSWVEEKRASLVWHYRQSDPEFGTAKAHQLVSELSEMAFNMPMTVRRGKMIVEVCTNLVDKGAAMRKFLKETSCDLALCAGDDQTDETMFRSELPNLISVKVGPGETAARYRVPSQWAFRSLLGNLLSGLRAAEHQKRSAA